MCVAHFLENYFHVLIATSKGKNRIDFGFTRSKVKVTMVTCKNNVNMFLLIIFRTVYPRAFIFYMLIGLVEGMIPLIFKFTRSTDKVTRVTFVKVCKHLLFILRTLDHRAFLFHILIGRSENTIPNVHYVKGQGYMGHLCDQLFKQFRLNVLVTIDYKA